MRDIAITVDKLGKLYHINESRHGRSLADRIGNLFRRDHNAPIKVIEDDSPDSIWAVRDVSFEVPRGDVVGIIGRNGSGKSTLMRMLAQITTPTVGFAELRGRVGALLEVGTGFHPDLSGRENVFLNGAIIGMTRRETARRLDEIVEFAGVGRFIDTPVKHYSSGMFMRLAFAVAAHLEAEIMLVDEVLAVGDAPFQKKCLTKIREIANHDRTVMFISHDMSAVASLCDWAILLNEGKMVHRGSIPDCTRVYYDIVGMPQSDAPSFTSNSAAPG